MIHPLSCFLQIATIFVSLSFSTQRVYICIKVHTDEYEHLEWRLGQGALATKTTTTGVFLRSYPRQWGGEEVGENVPRSRGR